MQRHNVRRWGRRGNGLGDMSRTEQDRARAMMSLGSSTTMRARERSSMKVFTANGLDLPPRRESRPPQTRMCTSIFIKLDWMRRIRGLKILAFVTELVSRKAGIWVVEIFYSLCKEQRSYLGHHDMNLGNQHDRRRDPVCLSVGSAGRPSVILKPSHPLNFFWHST